MKANDATEVGERLRDARFETLKVCVDLARSEQVDFVVITGDLFESNQVSALTVSRAVQALQHADPIPIYVLPGNHDWLDAGSVYEGSDFAPNTARNIVVLREREPMVIGEECIVYPCPLTKRWDLADPTDWIPGRDDEDSIRIGIAHGSLPVPDKEREFPIEADTPQRKGLDYLALGDWHGMRIYESNRLAYAGTPEQTSFGEERAGHVLLVAIDQAGQPPQIEARQVGRLSWLTWEREVSASAVECLASLRDEIEGMADGPSTLLRLTLTGAVRSDELPLVDQFETWLQARCDNQQLLYAELRDKVRTTEALEEALRELSESDSVIAGSAADLRGMAAVDDGRDEGVADVTPRGTDELITTWTRTDPGEQEMSVVSRDALKLLAKLVGEVS